MLEEDCVELWNDGLWVQWEAGEGQKHTKRGNATHSKRYWTVLECDCGSGSKVRAKNTLTWQCIRCVDCRALGKLG